MLVLEIVIITTLLLWNCDHYYTYTKLDVLECSDGAWTNVLLKAGWWLLRFSWEVGFWPLGVVKVVEGVLKRTPLLLVVVFLLLADFSNWNSFRLRVLYFGVLFRVTLLLVEVCSWSCCCWVELASQEARAASWELGPLHGVPEPWIGVPEPLMLEEVSTLLDPASSLLVALAARVAWLEVIVWREEVGPLHGVLEPLMYQPPVWVNRYLLELIHLNRCPLSSSI